MQEGQNIQGTPHAGNRWKQNLDAHLTENGYVCNNVDKAFFRYHCNNELMAMLSTTVDDFYYLLRLHIFVINSSTVCVKFLIIQHLASNKTLHFSACVYINPNRESV